MITTIELGNFLSHTETKLDVENGVTVFVGHNGAGKSSIIDAITFALFGQHTRKSNKGLIKRGENQGYAKIEFLLNGKKYQAVRKVDNKGSMTAKFSEIINSDVIEIAAGERKQFGESMTHEIEKTIGLDFEKLKIASIVQQGELNTIIKAKPKEFKELLNAIIRIDRLDVAAENMKIIIKEFREEFKKKTGYDDTEINMLQRKFQECQKEININGPQKERLEIEKNSLHLKLLNLRRKFETDAPKIDKILQIEQLRNELRTYAKEAIIEIQKDIEKQEQKIRECEECFKHVDQKKNIETKIDMVENAVNDANKKIQDLTSMRGSLNEKKILASKLQLKDNRCPVCDSKVDRLNPLFQEAHLNEEIKKVQEQISNIEKEQYAYNQKRIEFSKKLQDARDSEAILRMYSVTNQEDIKKIKENIETKKQNIQIIPSSLSNNLVEISKIDMHTQRMFETILKLEEETREFNEEEFHNLKKSIDECQKEVSQLDQQIGVITEKITRNKEQINQIQNIIKELDAVKEYVTKLEYIKSNIFSRDGSVATSLRSWALNTISTKASEYLTLLDTKIQSIHLSEKTRDISITCYSRTEVLELESLSGGEQVVVALALRLGMASLLGASSLGLMILDEPTTHLDVERRKSLVGVLSNLSNITNSRIPMQFIIITHDSEIFEDSNVDQIYKFESTEQGSKVTAI